MSRYREIPPGVGEMSLCDGEVSSSGEELPSHVGEIVPSVGEPP
ncbi:hypothetical protein ABE021_04640 [Sporosarcina gallistercoris]